MSHDMATVHHGHTATESKTNRSMEFDPYDHLPLPTTQYDASQQGALGYWIQSAKQENLPTTKSGFSNLTIVEQATLIFNSQFAYEDQVYNFMHACIKNEMIWCPNCTAIDANLEYTIDFKNYCWNWLQIIFQVLCHTNKIEWNLIVLQEIEMLALAKLNELHANLPYSYQKANLQFTHATFISSPWKPLVKDADITLQSYPGRNHKPQPQPRINGNTTTVQDPTTQVLVNMDQLDDAAIQQQPFLIGNYLKMNSVSPAHRLQYVDVEQQIQQQANLDYKQSLEHAVATYNSMEDQLPNISNVQERQKRQLQIQQLRGIVQKHLNQLLQLEQQANRAKTLQEQLQENQQLLAQQQRLSQQVLDMNKKQSQQQLLFPQQPLQEEQKQNVIPNAQQQRNMGQSLTPTNSNNLHLLNPTQYSQHGVDLLQHESGSWMPKEHFKKKEAENKKLEKKFTGKEANVQEAAVQFIVEIQTEAESLIE